MLGLVCAKEISAYVPSSKRIDELNVARSKPPANAAVLVAAIAIPATDVFSMFIIFSRNMNLTRFKASFMNGSNALPIGDVTILCSVREYHSHFAPIYLILTKNMQTQLEEGVGADYSPLKCS